MSVYDDDVDVTEAPFASVELAEEWDSFVGDVFRSDDVVSRFTLPESSEAQWYFHGGHVVRSRLGHVQSRRAYAGTIRSLQNFYWPEHNLEKGFEDGITIDHGQQNIFLVPQTTLPAVERYRELEDELERAKGVILGLPDDWDGEGAEPFTAEGFDRAAELTRSIISLSVEEFSGSLIVPTISPTPESSIDVYWNHPIVTLLLNVPCAPEKPPTFSGRRGTELLRGRLARVDSRVGYLAAWLAQR